MKNNIYKIIVTLEDIFRKDILTMKYNIEGADDPDYPPDPDSCPTINVFPNRKTRTLARISSKPYIVEPELDIIIWEMSLADFKDAFKRLDEVEENVCEVLNKNRKINGLVRMLTLGESVYEHVYYQDTFFIKGTLSITVDVER